MSGITSMKGGLEVGGCIAILIAAVVAPFLFPGLQTQLTMLWVMVLIALTWDVVGGQMGYNSFGNVIFFGLGMYATAVIQVGLFYDVGTYTDAQGAAGFALTTGQYFSGLALGLLASALIGVVFAVVIGAGLLGLRGHYFAIGTLGLGIAFGEIFAGWDWVGAGSGMVPPLFPSGTGLQPKVFYYFMIFLLTVVTFFSLKRLYSGRFGLAINAIRDDEDKAEAMGLRTTRYKTIAWAISALFLAIGGGLVGNVLGFIDPRDSAFAGATFGVWMVLMAILGGKGLLWGPVVGAVVFHVTQELFWTYLLGWQRVALGLLIVIIVVFFPLGILGWLRERKPELFGYRVEEDGAASEGKAS